MLSYLPRYFSSKAIGVYFIVLLLITLIAFGRNLPLLWVLFGLIEVYFFFSLSTTLTRNWSTYSNSSFKSKLFRLALIIRLFFVVFSYFFFEYMTGTPFEFEAADSVGYDGEARWIIGLFDDGKFDVYLKYIGINYADMGYPLYLSVIYYFTNNSILIARIIKAFLSAYCCLMIYQVTQRNFGESTGRIAGILAMLLPNFIFYCGLHVKETEMVFLVTAYIYLADKILYGGKIQIKHIILLILMAGLLFFFRTVLAVCMLGSLGISVIFTSSRFSSWSRKLLLFFLIIFAVGLLFSSSLGGIINEYIKASDENLASQMDNYSTRTDGDITSNKLAKYGSKSIFLPLMISGPMPTLVNTGQENSMMLAGGFLVRNIYAFFVFVALFALYKRKAVKEHILLLSALFSYLFVLGSSGFALSERFHLPAVPILLIFTAYGISQMNQKNKKYFIPYLVFISAIVIFWNLFKLAGRGLA